MRRKQHRIDPAREALDLVGEAKVPKSLGWLTARRALLLTVTAFMLAGMAVIGCVVLLYLQVANADDEAKARRDDLAAATEKARLEVLAELDRRTAERDLEDAAQEARIRAAVCIVLPDIPSPSDQLRELSQALDCPMVPGETAPGAPGEQPTQGETGRFEPSPDPGPDEVDAFPSGPEPPPASVTDSQAQPPPRPAPSDPGPPSPPAEPERDCAIDLLGACVVP